MRASIIFPFLAAMSTAFAGLDEPLDALKKTYGEIVETSTYRPDLFATSYKFKSDDATIEATVLPDVVTQIDVFFAEEPSATVELLLERYSGRGNWTIRPLTDPDFARQYPFFSTKDSRNKFFVAAGAFALVQRDVAGQKIVLRMQSATYLHSLEAYRREKKEGK